MTWIEEWIDHKISSPLTPYEVGLMTDSMNSNYYNNKMRIVRESDEFGSYLDDHNRLLTEREERMYDDYKNQRYSGYWEFLNHVVKKNGYLCDDGYPTDRFKVSKKYNVFIRDINDYVLCMN